MTDTSRPRNVTINKLTVSSEQHWRTSASVITGKDGHRWWLWVFVTYEATVFVMDPSRSAEVAADKCWASTGSNRRSKAGRRLVISSDFYKAYQSLATIDGVDPLWCRAQYAEPGIMRNGASGWRGLLAVAGLAQMRGVGSSA